MKTICQNTTRVLYIKWKKFSATIPIQVKEMFTTLLIMQRLLYKLNMFPLYLYLFILGRHHQYSSTHPQASILLMNKLTTTILDKLLLPSILYQVKPIPSPLLPPVTVQ